MNARDTDSILNYNILKNNIIFAIWGDFINHTVKKSLTTTLSWWRWYMVDFFSGRTDHIKSGDKLSSVIVNKQEEENRSDLGHGNWQTHILATCVSSHSNIPANWPAICWLAKEKSYTYAQNATDHSFKLKIWRLTCSFTAGGSHTNVLNATTHSDLLDIWRLTCWGKDA